MNNLDKVRTALTVIGAFFAAHDLFHLLYYGYYIPYYVANTRTWWLVARLALRWQLGGRLIRTGHPRLAAIAFFELFWTVADFYYAPYMIRLAKGGEYTIND